MTKNPIQNDTYQLAKSFEPQQIESHWDAQWERKGYFTGGRHVAPANPDQSKPVVIQFPPPNVTGTLHMGHAFNQTIMDGLVRYHRMRGDDTVFVPGTDHAGIATQIVVERRLDAEKISRHRSEEHTSELQSLMRISYAVFCLKKKITTQHNPDYNLI